MPDSHLAVQSSGGAIAKWPSDKTKVADERDQKWHFGETRETGEVSEIGNFLIPSRL